MKWILIIMILYYLFIFIFFLVQTKIMIQKNTIPVTIL